MNCYQLLSTDINYRDYEYLCRDFSKTNFYIESTKHGLNLEHNRFLNLFIKIWNKLGSLKKMYVSTD